ncbi:3'(2'),5'-bisphosphate nucleotidase CysQ [Leeuwenhoekiella palythoae]|uniref:3'(2'),5'-bisphosphate nucleotidase CysQ n=1 Tax=Leeuwenhoekiella palythoae TaxID=573501 RepID=A0A1M5UDV0_9FLAO|nr:3'(2'),5'-bisphosphate nucleotidase CysQ [Leeuwenhoekiella palythoae]RXG27150.1 3'(2'),5'-bisphosphate nucleotidase [Leeuwenhoekiella palythoae]SHH61129.1 3'(2'),5'-bisphosphate nucleotidase [Leeuwenhoekiella palythoae]
MDLTNHLNTAINAALEAGKRILEIYHNEDFDVDFKSDASPLTKADTASHHIIMSYLEKTGIPVLSEEGKDIAYETRNEWEYLWIVDPIDGTKEFIKKNGEFTVNIALIQNGVPILGVIYVPVLQELFYAAKDLGSFKAFEISTTATESEVLAAGQQLPLAQERRQYTAVASKSHLSRETEDYIKGLEAEYGEVAMISKGSSLKLCMVAEGKADCYPRFAPTMEWDTAAGSAICKYAGKTVLDWETKKEMVYNRADLLNNWFLVE